MNRRGFLQSALAAPAIVRSGVLMPIVPIVAAAPLLPWQRDIERWLSIGADGGLLVPPEFSQRIEILADGRTIVRPVLATDLRCRLHT